MPVSYFISVFAIYYRIVISQQDDVYKVMQQQNQRYFW